MVKVRKVVLATLCAGLLFSCGPPLAPTPPAATPPGAELSPARITSPHYPDASLDWDQSAIWSGAEYGFLRPEGVATNSDGMIYVADTGNHRIKIFNTDGTLAGSWGSNGDGPGQFAGHHSGPRGIAIDAWDNVYVVDAAGGRILKFTAQGDFITAWGEPGTAPGQFTADDLRGPQGIALDGAGNVYVADTAAGRIQKFTGDGAWLAEWPTALPGETRASPTWLAVSNDRLYVTDRVGQRVQYYDLDGTATGVWAGTEFKNIGGIAVSPTGAVYVADKQKLSIFTPDGVALRTIRPYNDGRAHPAAVALGLAGQVYVVDRTGNYISAFSSER